MPVNYNHMPLKLFRQRPISYAYLRTPEYRSIPKLRLVNIVVIGLMAAIVGSTTFFLYESVYTVIGQIQAITALQSNVSSEAVNFEQLEKVQAAWDKKHDKKNLDLRRDPFASPTSTSSNSDSTLFKTGCPSGPCAAKKR